MKFLQVFLLLAAFAVMQLLFGGGDGTRAIYTLPGYVILGVSGVLMLLSAWKAQARMDRACLLSSAVVALYLFARIAFSPSAWLASFDFYALLGAVLMYFVTALAVTGNLARSAATFGLLVLAVSHVALGVYQFAKDSNFHPLVPSGRGDTGFRASGFYISPNHLAGFLEVALLLSLSLCFWGGFRVRGKMLTGYLALVCLGGLVMTGSRGGYLSTGVGLTVFACMSIWTLRSRLSRGMLPSLIGIITAIAIVGGGLAYVANRSFAIRDRTNNVFTTDDVRLQLWESAWKQFQLAPVLGTGSRTFVYYGRMFHTQNVDKDPVFVHSDWLQLLAEYGIVGVLLVLGFIIAHLHHGWQRWKRMVARLSTGAQEPGDGHALAIQIGTISAVAACLVHAVMDFNLHIPANSLLAAFLFGLLATRRTRTDEQNPSWMDRTLHAIPAGLGIWMLILSVPRIRGEMFAESARGNFATGQILPAIHNSREAILRGVRNPNLYFHLGEVQRMMSDGLKDSEAKRWALIDAHEAYTEALKIFPQDVGIVLRDAWVLSRAGLFKEAEPLLSRAQKLDPNSPKPWLYSALFWKYRAKPAEALADFRKAEALSRGWVPSLLVELHEEFDPAEMEKLLQNGGAANPK